MTPDSEARLRAHVDGTISRAAIATSERADVAEELLGHLEEQVEAYLAAGLDEAVAVSRAIADFGTADAIGRDLGGAYHSRLWASTIGILLPPLVDLRARPVVVGWLRFLLGVDIVFSAVALAVLLATEPPVRALVAGGSLALGLGVAILAFQSLPRGQRWALWYAIGTALVMLLTGVWQVLRPDPPGSITIPLLAILAGGVLFVVMKSWPELRAFVVGSAMPGRLLGIGLGFALVAPVIVPPLIPELTQASPSDVRMDLTLTCSTGDLRLDGGTQLPDIRQAELTTDVHWAKADVLPKGVIGLFSQSDFGDTVGWRVTGPPPWWWLWAQGPEIVDVSTGAAVGSWGSTAPSIGLLPQEVAGSNTIAIEPAAIRPGHTVRTTWTLYTETDQAWPQIEVFYAHLDRFLLAGTVGCGQTVVAAEVPIAPSE